MGRVGTYQIPDEPTPGPFARFSVQPFWPLLATMLGGVWIGWPWFVLNGWLIGSATRRRELALVVGGFVVSAAFIVGLLALSESVIPVKALPYVALLGVAWKLGVSYRVQVDQERSFSLYRYFGGSSMSGMLPVAAGLLLRASVIGLFPKQPEELRVFLIWVLL